MYLRNYRFVQKRYERIRSAIVIIGILIMILNIARIQLNRQNYDMAESTTWKVYENVIPGFVNVEASYHYEGYNYTRKINGVFIPVYNMCVNYSPDLYEVGLDVYVNKQNPFKVELMPYSTIYEIIFQSLGLLILIIIPYKIYKLD